MGRRVTVQEPAARLRYFNITGVHEVHEKTAAALETFQDNARQSQIQDSSGALFMDHGPGWRRQGALRCLTSSIPSVYGAMTAGERTRVRYFRCDRELLLRHTCAVNCEP